MKKIQNIRLGVQLLYLILTVGAFFSNIKIFMLVIMGLMLLSGVFYCGWICPFGFIQDTFNNLGRLVGIKKRKMPIVLQKVLVFIRYIIFGLVSLIGAELVYNFMSFDPRINFEKLLSGNMVMIGSIGIICFFIFISFFFDRPFCNYFCYEGAKYGVLSIFRFFTVKRNESKCVNCKKCNEACPMNIQVSKCSNLRSPQCINCFQCVSSCPVNNTLSYGKCNMTKTELRKYLAMFASLFVIIAIFKVYNIFTGTNPLQNNHDFNPTNKEITAETLPSTLDDIADGVYIGEGIGFKSTISVQVTVKNREITAVEVVGHRDDRAWFDMANDVIPSRIIEKQSTNIDVVSGATYSSLGIIEGVKNALEKAK